MSPFFVKAVQLLLSLSILIILHELGHFIPARAFKCRVEKFFLFFDIKFALWKKKIGETVYGIGWLPLGGYVKIAGMIDESMDKEQMKQPPQPWEFRSKPTWQRLIIMLGGVTVNLIVGFLIYMMILFVWGRAYSHKEDIKYGFGVSATLEKYGFQQGDQILNVNGEPLFDDLDISLYLLVRDVEYVEVLHADGTQETIRLPEDIGDELFQAGDLPPITPRNPFVVDSIAKDGAAWEGGMKKGDKIVALNGYKVDHFSDFAYALKKYAEDSLDVKVERDGREIVLRMKANDKGKLGFVAKNTDDDFVKRNREEFSFLESISGGFKFGYWTLHDYVVQFKYIFTKKGAGQLGGFGAIGSLFPSQWNWEGFWRSTALISIILAFMNVLPIPALDGGHVAFLLYEMVTGRKPGDKFLEYAQMIGFFLLIALVLYANGNDIYRWLFE